MKCYHLKQCPISKSNSYDQNFMKLGHMVKYHNVFFKFDNGSYRSMLSELLPFVQDDVFHESSIMVYMALCHHEFLPFVDEKSQFL